MRRRKLLVALAVLAAVIAAGVVAVWLQPSPPSRVTRENFDLINAGMSQEEVYAILGPPGDYTTKQRIPLAPAPELRSGLTEWRADNAIYWVRFNRNGGGDVVTDSGFWPNVEPDRPEPISFLERVRRDLRRLFGIPA
jgi:hypothetical protein